MTLHLCKIIQKNTFDKTKVKTKLFHFYGTSMQTYEDIFVHLKNQFHKSVDTTTRTNLRSLVLRSQAQRLQSSRFHLYDILEKAKARWHKPSPAAGDGEHCLQADRKEPL